MNLFFFCDFIDHRLIILATLPSLFRADARYKSTPNIKQTQQKILIKYLFRLDEYVWSSRKDVYHCHLYKALASLIWKSL